MPGRHAVVTPHQRSRNAVPLAVSLVAAAVLGGGAYLGLRPDAHAAATPLAVTATPDRTPQVHVGRAAVRSSPSPGPEPTTTDVTPEPATTTDSPKPQPKPSSSSPKPVPVVSSGTCGVSFYSEPQPTASGEPFDPDALTAAHKSLPFNTRVRVTNPSNGKSVTVRINDRGPYVDGRCLDLSRAAFEAIADLDSGVINGRYEILGNR